jgi:uncharacterized protein
MKKTVVLGASDNPERYSYLAVQRLRSQQHPVVAIGRKEATVADVDIVTTQDPIENVDTVTLYLNPTAQQEYYDYIFSLNPKRIIFNPGTENVDFAARASARGIEALEACTLVLLSTGMY